MPARGRRRPDEESPRPSNSDCRSTGERTRIAGRIARRADAFLPEEEPMEYVLPDLPYDFGELEPHVSGKIIELHHQKHHKAYVDKANAALEKLSAAREKADMTSIPALERALAFNLSGHVLHALYWQNMSPEGGGTPDGELGAAIEDSFMSFDGFKQQMTEAVNSTMGSGWGALVWEPVAKRLLVTQIYDHQSNFANGSLPIYVIDAWEHAYYLQYNNKKDEYAKAIWNVANWADVSKRLACAVEFDPLLDGCAK
jgi:superoxide dismutase, Fe-Mn family